MDSKEIRDWQDAKALERMQMIAPLTDPEMDAAKRSQLREQIAAANGVNIRTLYRYEKAYRESSFGGLRPMNREMRRSAKLPENYDEIVAQAKQLKMEVPRRSVRQIIKILETEGYAAPGMLKQSTLRRHLFKAGMGRKQLKRYSEGRETASRRFCRPHRMELVQGDIKYGPVIRGRDGRLIKTYLSSLIDDHSRYILQSEFYDNQREEIVEDTFHKAVLHLGVFDSAYLDNGRQYITARLQESCAKLGIRLLHAKPRACESKGKIEKWHQVVDRFLAELKVDNVHSIEELNERWKCFLEEDYQKEPHEGIREYYKAQGVEVPAGGISPLQEWNRDSRTLKFLDVGTVAEAFMRRETRRIDNAGCFSFRGFRYEAGTALIGAEVEIVYDPLHIEEIEVRYPGAAPVKAKKAGISSFGAKKAAIPISMTGKASEGSRFLDAMEKRNKKSREMKADAISFAGYSEGGSNV